MQVGLLQDLLYTLPSAGAHLSATELFAVAKYTYRLDYNILHMCYVTHIISYKQVKCLSFTKTTLVSEPFGVFWKG